MLIAQSLPRSLLLSLLLIAISALPASADDRYTMVKTDKGAVRVDKKSGAVSYCREAGGSVICSIAADERKAWSAEVERLTARLEELEKRMDVLSSPKAQQPDKQAQLDTQPQSPSAPATAKEDGLDKAMDKVEGLMRRVIGVAKEAKKEWDSN